MKNLKYNLTQIVLFTSASIVGYQLTISDWDPFVKLFAACFSVVLIMILENKIHDLRK